MNRALVIIILMAAPLLANAEETVRSHADASLQGSSEKAATAEDKSDIEMRAALLPKLNRTGSLDRDLILSWRERVFKSVSQFADQGMAEPERGTRLLSHQEQAKRSQEGRIITRTILNETWKFTQEKLPDIDRLVKSLRLEVSTEKPSPESSPVPEGADNEKIQPVAPHRLGDRVFIKSGLRVPVESGKLSLLSETEAVFGALSTFFKIYIDGRYDNSAGMAYVVAKDIRLQVEQRTAHTGTEEGKQELSHLSLMQLVCAF